MVAHRLCETLVERDARSLWDITVLGEELRPAYDRVQLTKYFETRDPASLAIATREYYAEHGITLTTGAGGGGGGRPPPRRGGAAPPPPPEPPRVEAAGAAALPARAR